MDERAWVGSSLPQTGGAGAGDASRRMRAGLERDGFGGWVGWWVMGQAERPGGYGRAWRLERVSARIASASSWCVRVGVRECECVSTGESI